MGKRWMTVAMSLALCLALLPAAAAAEEERLPQTPRLPQPEFVLVKEPGPWDGEEAGLLAEPDYAGAIEALRQGVVDRADTIRLSQYHIPADLDIVDQMIHYVCYRYGELFALDPDQRWMFTRGSDGVVGVAKPPYRPEMDAEGYAQARAFYEAELQAIVDQVPAGFSDGEKVLFIHDYLAANYEYDYDFAIYDAYGLLREGKGVCQAYMLTFSALMDRLDIPVSYVESDLLNHAWNVVRVGENWYHVDVTWDDPAIGGADVLGAASHAHFLLSDQTNEALRRAWAEENGLEYVNDQLCGREVTCPDDAYETGPWAQADSPVVYVPETESWYYLSTDRSDKGLYRWSGDAAQDPVRVGDYSPRYYGGTAPLVEYQGCLYFADPDQVNRYELSTGTTQVLCAAEGETYKYSGLRLEDGQLFIKDRATGTVTPFQGQLLPWRQVGDSLASYYYHFGQVEVELGENAPGNRFLMAWYDGATGQMTALRSVTADGSFGQAGTGKDLECMLFILCDDDTLVPVLPKVSLKPQPALEK